MEKRVNYLPHYVLLITQMRFPKGVFWDYLMLHIEYVSLLLCYISKIEFMSLNYVINVTEILLSVRIILVLPHIGSISTLLFLNFYKFMTILIFEFICSQQKDDSVSEDGF